MIELLDAAHSHACKYRKQTIAQMVLHTMEIEVAMIDRENRSRRAEDMLHEAQKRHEDTFDLRSGAP